MGQFPASVASERVVLPQASLLLLWPNLKGVDMYRSILIAHRDPGTAQALATALHTRFPSVRMAGSMQELEAAIPKYKVDAVICDLETVDLSGVNKLANNVHIIVICTHRVPDEAMWIASIEAGAADCCAASDSSSIISALERISETIARAA